MLKDPFIYRHTMQFAKIVKFVFSWIMAVIGKVVRIYLGQITPRRHRLLQTIATTVSGAAKSAVLAAPQLIGQLWKRLKSLKPRPPSLFLNPLIPDCVTDVTLSINPPSKTVVPLLPSLFVPQDELLVSLHNSGNSNFSPVILDLLTFLKEVTFMLITFYISRSSHFHQTKPIHCPRYRMLFSLVFVLITVLVHSSFSSPLKSFDLDESDFVPRVCIEIINNDNPFVQEIIWRSTKEINDKFDDKFYLLPLKSIKAKRNACVAGYEYLLEFQVVQSVYAKTEVLFDDLKDFPVDFDGFGQVLVCKTNVYEEPFGKREQISIENCTNV